MLQSEQPNPAINSSKCQQTQTTSLLIELQQMSANIQNCNNLFKAITNLQYGC